MDYFNSHPGTYFLTGGWLERGSRESAKRGELSIQHKTGMDKSYEDMVKEYGEDNAKYLWETLCDTLKNYSAITYIDTGTDNCGVFERAAKEEAASRGWDYRKEQGTVSLIQKLLDGPPWSSEEFLEVPPGFEIKPSFDNLILRAEGMKS